MVFTKNMKMADIIHANYLLLPVISRFGIKLGFGDKLVEEVCNIHDINVDFFIEIINAFHDEEYYVSQDLQQFPIQLTIDYLSKTHNWYLEKKYPKLSTIFVKWWMIAILKKKT